MVSVRASVQGSSKDIHFIMATEWSQLMGEDEAVIQHFNSFKNTHAHSPLHPPHTHTNTHIHTHTETDTSILGIYNTETNLFKN